MMIRAVMAVAAVVVVVGSSKVKGPPVADRRTERHVAREGEEVKLKCPIQGHPAPMVTWTRAGEVIDFSWTRFRTNKRNLKIRGVSKEDRGRYKCKGINGFGSAEVVLELLVMGAEELEGLDQDQLEQLAPPAFTSEEEEEVLQEEGEEVVLECSVTGYPEPSVLWYRGGSLLREGGARLVVPGLLAGSEGAYSCRAANLVGSVQRQFTVTRVPPTAEPARLSVVEGGAATLDCRVRAAITPSIRWLKKLEQEEEGALSVGRDFYRMVESEEETVVAGVGEYLSQLVVQPARASDAGMYICFVTSPRGRFNFQPSYLTVLQGGVATEGSEDTPILILVICISVVVTLLLIGAAACLVQRRHKTPAASPPASVVISTSSGTPERSTILKASPERGVAAGSERQAGRLEEMLREQVQPLAPEPRYLFSQAGEYLGQEYQEYSGQEYTGQEYQEYHGQEYLGYREEAPDYRMYGAEGEEGYLGYPHQEGHNLYEVPGHLKGHSQGHPQAGQGLSLPRSQYGYSQGQRGRHNTSYTSRR